MRRPGRLSDLVSEALLSGSGGPLVHGAIYGIAAIELLVQPHQHDAQYERGANGQEDHAAVDAHRQDVSGAGATGIHVTCVDARGVGHGIDEGKGRGSLGRWSGQGVGDPGEGDDEGGVDTGDHEHHGEVAGAGGGSGGGDDEGDEGEAERDHDVEEALAGFIGVPGVGHGGYDG